MTRTSLAILVTASLFLWSCDSDSHHHSEGDHHVHTHEEMVSSTPNHTLQLNDGQKWETDESTRLHASNLIRIVNDFEAQGKKGMSDFKQFGDQLQSELQELINGCTMKGPDHDALHNWLEPLLHTVDQLQHAASEEQAQELSAQAGSEVKQFDQYFH